jgi:Protein of unknown function (DUF3231)
MEFMKAVFSREPDPNHLHMGDVISVWDVARNKLIGLSTLSIYYRQATDKELKDLVEDGIKFVLNRHINKIQKLLNDKGYDFPSGQNWEKKLDENTPFVIPNTMIDDEGIAMSLREIIRLTLSLEAEGLRKTTDKDIRDLLADIMEDDNRGLGAVLALQRKKQWKDFPPTVFSQ